VLSAADLPSPAAPGCCATAARCFWIAHVHAATVARPARRLALGLDPGGPAVCGLIPGVTLTEGVRAALVVAIVEQQLWGYAACPQPAPDRRPGQDDPLTVLAGCIIVSVKVAAGH
jgi:hypothetical protein